MSSSAAADPDRAAHAAQGQGSNLKDLKDADSKAAAAPSPPRRLKKSTTRSKSTLTLFIPSYDEDVPLSGSVSVQNLTLSPVSAQSGGNSSENPLQNGKNGSKIAQPQRRISTSPDSAFQTGSEFNTTDDSLEQSQSPNNVVVNSAQHENVENWVRTTMSRNVRGPGQLPLSLMSPETQTSTEDYDDVLSIGNRSAISASTIVKPAIEISDLFGRGKFVIQEEIEEIITTNSYGGGGSSAGSESPAAGIESDDDEVESRGGDRRRTSLVNDFKNLNSILGNPAAVATLTGDAGDSLTFEHDSHLNHLFSWEHNWLFKKKKFIPRRNCTEIQRFRSTMFIPNPIQYYASQQFSVEEDEEELAENEDLSLEWSDLEESESESESEIEDADKSEEEIRDDLKAVVAPKEHQLPTKVDGRPLTKQKERFERVVTVPAPPLAFLRPVPEFVDNPPISLESNQETLRETSTSLIASDHVIEVHQPQPGSKMPDSNSKSEKSELATRISPPAASEAATATATAAITAFEALGNDCEESPVPTPTMRIAEREMQKWNNPVNIAHNPYTPENLLKRISKNSFLHSFGLGSGGGAPASVSDSGNEFGFDSISKTSGKIYRNEKIRRDYFVNADSTTTTTVGSAGSKTDPCGTPSVNSKERIGLPTTKQTADLRSNRSKESPSNQMPVLSTPRKTYVPSSYLGDARVSTRTALVLPSVRNLAQQFSSKPSPESETIVSKQKPPAISTTPKISAATSSGYTRGLGSGGVGVGSVQKEIYSITARSVPKQFRAGLNLSKPTNHPNSNVKMNYKQI